MHARTQSNYGKVNFTQHTHQRSDLDKDMVFQRRSERLNGVLDVLGEDIPKGGSDIPESSLAVPLCLGILGPGNMKEISRC